MGQTYAEASPREKPAAAVRPDMMSDGCQTECLTEMGQTCAEKSPSVKPAAAVKPDMMSDGCQTDVRQDIRRKMGKPVLRRPRGRNRLLL